MSATNSMESSSSPLIVAVLTSNASMTRLCMPPLFLNVTRTLSLLLTVISAGEKEKFCPVTPNVRIAALSVGVGEATGEGLDEAEGTMLWLGVAALTSGVGLGEGVVCV